MGMEVFQLYGSIFIDTKKAKKSISSTGKNIQEVGKKIEGVGKKMNVLSGAIGGVFVASVKTAADFEASMSQVAATMGITADEINKGSEEFEKLQKAARDMGASTKYSASEAADALNYLALAGYNADQAIETLPTVLNLAAAGGIDLASASNMVTDAMSALGDKAGTLDSFVDKMAVTAQKSNTSVAELGEAILTVGGTAKVLSGGVTEMNTAIGILADNGIHAAEGGTALRNIILALSAPTDKAAKKLDELGITAYTASGDLRPLNDIFNDLNSVMSTMSQEEQTDVLNTIFNKVDLKSANALLANSGERFNELSMYINQSNGAAKDMADTMENNLQGQLTRLKSALEEAGISIGEQLVPIIKDLVALIQEWTDKFNNLSDEQKQVIIKVGLFVAALGPVITVLGTIITSVGSIIHAFSALVPFFSTVATGFEVVAGVITGPILFAIGLVIAAIGTWIYYWEDIKEATRLWYEELGYMLQDIVDKIKNTVEKIKSLIKLPHFSIEGSLSLNPPSVPKLAVDWYAKAMDNPMIMNSPTIFGVNKNGQPMAGGEAGSEVVSGTDTLMSMIRGAVGSAINKDLIVSAITEAMSMSTLAIDAELEPNTNNLFNAMRIENARFKKRNGNYAY